MIPLAFLRAGRAAPPPDSLTLQAGPLSLRFDPETALLRAIRLGDREVVRAIYGAVRDRHWGTVTPRVEITRAETHARSFILEFAVTCQEEDVDFDWHGRIQGDEQGTVSYAFEGEARRAFWRNRIGLCLLHPLAECAGEPCTVTHPDGTLEASVFPRFVSPHQPFKAVEALTHEVAPGTRAEVRFRGDSFETEDQRNWTDASFKTYSTPLELAHPVRIEAGTRVSQSITLRLLGRLAPPLRSAAGAEPDLVVDWDQGRTRPPVGLQLASHGLELSAEEIQRLERLELSHLRVDLELAGSAWPERLRQAAEQARLLGTRLHLALILSDQAEAELVALTGRLADLRPPVELALVFPQSDHPGPAECLALARKLLGRFDPRLPLATGSNAGFVDLNRRRPDPSGDALPCFPVSPQVHAFDDATCLENLEAQPDVIESLRQFCARPVVVSPITFRRRPRPGTGARPDQGGSAGLPFHVDPRQLSLLGAAWTLGSLAGLSVAPGVQSLTYFETTGWLGVMETSSGSPCPARFPSLPGVVFPLYHVFAQLARFPRAAPAAGPRPRTVVALGLIDPPDRRRVLVANLLPRPQNVRVAAGHDHARLRRLDETTAEAALTSPEAFLDTASDRVTGCRGVFELRLLPYAVAALDLAG